MDRGIEEPDLQEHLGDLGTVFLDLDAVVHEPEIPVDEPGDQEGALFPPLLDLVLELVDGLLELAGLDSLELPLDREEPEQGPVDGHPLEELGPGVAERGDLGREPADRLALEEVDVDAACPDIE